MQAEVAVVNTALTKYHIIIKEICLIFLTFRCRAGAELAASCRHPPICHKHTQGLETNLDLHPKSASSDHLFPSFYIGS